MRFLALPFASKADVIVHTANFQAVSTDSNHVWFQLNMNPSTDVLGDTVDDFQFTADLADVTDTVTPVGSNGYVGTASNNPTPLSAGAVVGPGSTFDFGTGVLQQTISDFQAGPWPGASLGVIGKPNGFAYLGVEFSIDGALHYGWVQLSACTPDFFLRIAAQPIRR